MRCIVWLSVVALLMGACAARKQACLCSRMYWPVCGTDLVTYSNECVLKCAVKKGTARSDVKVLRYGRCEDEKLYFHKKSAEEFHVVNM